MPEYIALRNHTVYSILDGTMSVEDLVQAVHGSGMPIAAITDRDTVAGAVQFYKKARALGIRPIIGSEVTMVGGNTVVLLVENDLGYSNLCQLLSTRIDSPDGVTPENMEQFAAGLICLWGPRSGYGEQCLTRIRQIYGRNLAVEISPHNEADLSHSRWAVAAARRMRLPIVATADAHYRNRADRLFHDILASMRTLTMLGQAHSAKLPAGHFHFHTPEEMQTHFGALPQALANTRLIAERCQFEFPLGDVIFPPFDSATGETSMEMLRRLSHEGMLRRYNANPPWERLERELGIIEEVGYSEYFLIFADIVTWCATQGIATLARGSAAGSLVCYVLGIGNVCPIRFNLLFERFLNRERMSFQKLADIDLDLPWDRRDDVMEYVFNRYGREKAAMIGAFNTFQGRAAVADIAKVYGIPDREVRRFTERLPWSRFTGESGGMDLIRESPECRHLPYDQEPWRTILAMAPRFDGVPRHFTMHPCGLVISARPITHMMPLFRSAKGILTTHYAMDDVEELGLLKMDLLGQAGLSVLRDSIANVKTNRGETIELDAIEDTDPATWDRISTGDARGVFHIESPNMNGLLVMTGCRDIDCLTALESVIRPGAANEGRKRAYARRLQGLEPVTYAHPSLEPALRETFGLLVYEEHILLVANGFAGLPWGKADMLRRALVKNKDHAKINAIGEEFRTCGLARGHSPKEIETVWEQLRDFAGYMFNKAHSAAYAVEAFQGAWIKTRYPVEYLASVLSNRRGFYSPIVYVLEALRAGARFLRPDIAMSDPHQFKVRGADVRLPLDQVKGLNSATVDRIAAGRPFTDAGDFFRRAKPQHDEWVALLKTGALDCFHEPRGRLFWRLSRLEAMRGTAPTLFEPDMPATEDSEPDAKQTLQARWEQELLGFPVSCHPLDYYAPGLDWKQFTPAVELLRNPQNYFGQEIEVAGVIVADRIHPTTAGPMKFVTLADPTGFMEVTMFASTYQEFGHVTVNPLVAAKCLAEPTDNRKGAMLNASRVYEPKRATRIISTSRDREEAVLHVRTVM